MTADAFSSTIDFSSRPYLLLLATTITITNANASHASNDNYLRWSYMAVADSRIALVASNYGFCKFHNGIAYGFTHGFISP